MQLHINFFYQFTTYYQLGNILGLGVESLAIMWPKIELRSKISEFLVNFLTFLTIFK